MRDSMKVDLLLLFHRSIFRNINKKLVQVFALLFCLGLSDCQELCLLSLVKSKSKS